MFQNNADPVLIDEIKFDYETNYANANDDAIEQSEDDIISSALWDGKSIDGQVTAEDLMDQIIDNLDFQCKDFRQLMTANTPLEVYRAGLELKDFLNNISKRYIRDV